jgi:hypothetical protein
MPDITPDTASHGAPQHAAGELRHTLSIHDVEAQLVAAGVERSHRQVIRYCESGLLDAVKIPGPTGEQWYIAPASVPKAIGDLKQWDAQRHGAPQHGTSSSVTPEKVLNSNSDTSSQSAPQHVMSEKQPSQKGSETEHVMARHGVPELDIYEHPYVKRLEERNEKLEAKYEAQVRRTEEIQMKSQQQLIELQRMTAIGQSETLADFMLKAKEWILGPGNGSADRTGTTETPVV